MPDQYQYPRRDESHPEGQLIQTHGSSRFVREIGGGLGDLGILLPLAILLIMNNGLSPAAVFIFIGFHYLITGYYFKIPLPVQPLKAMAVTALAMGASSRLVGAAGILMGGILLILAFGNLASLLEKIFTRPVIRGIQLAIGLFLVKQGLSLMMSPAKIFSGMGPVFESPYFSMVLGIGTGLFLFLLLPKTKIPATMIILPAGMLLGAVIGLASDHQFRMPYPLFPLPGSPRAFPEPIVPSWNELGTAFALLVIPQIPLTFANSVVSCCQVSRDYFGQQAKKVTPRALCVSLGLGNLLGGFFGGLPCCHGAGGLTSHYLFGARTGRATIFTGLLFLASGFLFGNSVHRLFALIPVPILGAFLVYAGVEHGLLVRDVFSGRNAAFVVLLIGTVSAGTGNIAVGFAAGMTAEFLMKRVPVPGV
jgi:SulP family sulfate permease